MTGLGPTVYGIDFGTANSRIAAVNETGQPEVARNQEGDLETPSVVYFEKGNPKPVVGKNAKRWALVAPSLVCADAKRHMGVEQWRFRPRDKEFRAEEICSFILRGLVHDAPSSHEAAAVPVVISVPLYFGDVERKATHKAADITGLDCKTIIPDPVAAAYAYGFGCVGKTQNALVCDIGATSQATVVAIDDGRLRAVATYFDRDFGGPDWDRALVEHCCRVVRQRTGVELPTSKPEVAQQLFDQAEQAKIKLSSANQVTMRVRLEKEYHSVDIGLAEFEAMTAELTERAVKIARGAVAKAKTAGVLNLDTLLLVGGTSNIPSIRRRFQDEFGLGTELDVPELAVVRGAAKIGDLIRQGKLLATDLPFGNFWSETQPQMQEDTVMNAQTCCGAPLPADARFCPRCGRPLGKCAACGRQLESEAHFCQYCGTPTDSGAATAPDTARGSSRSPLKRQPLRKAGADAMPTAPPATGALRSDREAEALLRAEAEQREREEEDQRRRVAEIFPGTWRQVPVKGLASLLPGMSPSLLQAMKGEFVWQLDSDGGLSGTLRVTGGLPPGLGGMLMEGMQMQLDFSGTWAYEYKTRVLTLEGSGVMQAQVAGASIPGMPTGQMSRRYRITGGSKDSWEAVADDDGSRHRFIRMLGAPNPDEEDESPLLESPRRGSASRKRRRLVFP